MKSDGKDNPFQKMQLRLWKKICVLTDGVAVSSTVFALRQGDILQKLATADRPSDVEELVTKAKKSGYYLLAFRLLEDQGILVRQSIADDQGCQVSFTPTGREWYLLSPAYDSAMDFHDAAGSLLDSSFLSPPPMNVLHGFSQLSDLEQRVRLHLVSPLVITFLVFLYDNGVISEGVEVFSEKDISVSPGLLLPCLTLLQDLGWILADKKGKWRFSEEGRLLYHFIPQLFYPLSYIKTFVGVPGLIFPALENTKINDHVEEPHIDRGLDIRFSGLVYKNNFRQPVQQILETIFNTESFKEQPRYIVDTGSGDGTVLLDVYRVIAEKTRRGQNLDEYPLTVVGIEYSRVAREATADRLRENEIPFLTLRGDISQPEEIAASLAEKGIFPGEVLHISKSVIHNRIYSPLQPEVNLDGWHPQSEGVFVSVNGDLIPPMEMVTNLVGHFLRWRCLVSRHGMIVIEAHSVSPASIAGSIGLNNLTLLDASHGYSHQYLVEKEIFHEAIQRAGYTIETVMERSLPGVDVVVLTVDYLQP